MAEPATDPFGGVDLDRVVRGAMPQATVDVPRVKAGITKAAEAETQAKAPVYDRIQSDIATDKAAVHRAQEGIEPVDIRPWNADKEREKYSTDIFQAFGSPAFIATMLASAFTKTPMVNALNAGGAALTAIKEKNDQSYDRAYEAFKTNADLAIKRHNIQRQAYEDAIKRLGVDRDAGMAELNVLTSKFGDEKSKALLEGGYIKELIDYQNSMTNAYRSMAAAMPQIEQAKSKHDAAKYLKEQGRTPNEIYHEIYAPAYSNSIGNLKAQMIRDKVAGGMKVEDAVRETEMSFKPQVAAGAVGPAYAKEFIEGVEKDGAALRPETKKLIQDTIGTTAKSGKTQETAARVAQAAEEIRSRKASGEPLREGEADQIIRDAVATETPQKIDQAIINQLSQYEGMDRRKLGYVGPKSQERILSALQSAEQIEHIAQYARDNPESVGLIADAARRVNVDAYKALISKPQDYILKITGDRDSAIEAAAKERGLSSDMVAKAKVLNKMLATQAFADAAQAGSRGATIYLDKAFREIYQQASSLPAFFDILHVRQRDANMNLGRYNLELERRKDADEKYKFWKNPGSYLEDSVKPRGGLPAAKERETGKEYPTPKGNLIWGGDGYWYTAQEWQQKNAGK